MLIIGKEKENKENVLVVRQVVDLLFQTNKKYYFSFKIANFNNNNNNNT